MREVNRERGSPPPVLVAARLAPASRESRSTIRNGAWAKAALARPWPQQGAKRHFLTTARLPLPQLLRQQCEKEQGRSQP